MADSSPSHDYNQADHQGGEPLEGGTGKNAGLANGLGQRLRRWRNLKQGGLLPLIGFSTISVGKESTLFPAKEPKKCKSRGDFWDIAFEPSRTSGQGPCTPKGDFGEFWAKIWDIGTFNMYKTQFNVHKTQWALGTTSQGVGGAHGTF